MKTFRIVLIATVTIVVLIFAAFFVVGLLKPKPAGIRVSTTPVSNVFVNGNFVGKTPYQGTYPAGSIDLKLVPGSSSASLIPYETKISLVGGVETVVRREFGTSEDSSSGDVLAFEKSPTGETSLIVISTPDNAQISVDGIERGFTPYKTSNITPAEHQITVRAEGYQDRVMTINTQKNYTLTIFVKLATGTGSVAGVQASPTPTPTATYVEIGKTPTGFLRIRTEPGTKGEEIAQVKPGEKFKYLETDSATGWFKIQYEDVAPGLPKGITGWVSNQYTSLATESAAVATPTPTP